MKFFEKFEFEVQKCHQNWGKISLWSLFYLLIDMNCVQNALKWFISLIRIFWDQKETFSDLDCLIIGSKWTKNGPKWVKWCTQIMKIAKCINKRPYTYLILPLHISEHKWDSNTARWTNHGPKVTIWTKTDQTWAQTDQKWTKNPFLAWFFLGTFLNRNGTEMQ